jgi:hypothetical protein
MEIAAAPSTATSTQGNEGLAGQAGYSRAAGTSSYAKMMQDSAISAKVDEAAAQGMKSQDQLLAQLRQEHAIGVVVAVRGEIVWADLFADTDLLSRYWTKLVRSYAAESLTAGKTRAAPSIANAQSFLDAPSGGAETSEGEVGVYRYRELNSGGTEAHFSHRVGQSKLKSSACGTRHQKLLPHTPRSDPAEPPRAPMVRNAG